ncbi:Gfo/Idh/MocA family oxidoreductase [Shinella sp. S4-D37]|uniref:Gfo/Idh/MocA family protein n=1 Tax=Shinella sp. S4-D37 TaxID=3161999 RepID=UPI003466D7CA
MWTAVGFDMRPVGIAIIGAGAAGHRLAAASSKLVRDYRESSERPRLMTIADHDGPRAAELARKFQFARWRVHWPIVLEDPEIDVVSISEPNNERIAFAAAKAGKNIHLEYHPFSSSSGVELVIAAQEAGISANVSYPHLSNPSIALLRDMISAGELGSIVHVRARLIATDAPRCMAEDFRQGTDNRQELKAILLAVLAIATKAVGEIRTIAIQGSGNGPGRPHVALRFGPGFNGTIEFCDGFLGATPSFQIEVQGILGTAAFDTNEPGVLKYQKELDGKSAELPTTMYPTSRHLPANVHWEFRNPHFDLVELKSIEMASFLSVGEAGGCLGANLHDARRLQDLINDALVQSTPHPFGI